MRPDIERFVTKSIAVWQRCPTCLPPLGSRFTPAEQSGKEALLDRLLASLEGEFTAGALVTRTERTRTHARISSAFAEFARSALELDDRHLALLVGEGFPAVGTSLGRLARRFDPDIGTAEILQACRNAWAACGLQALFGLPMSVTPSIFAYSMLYPYSDNYLDDERIPRESKVRFNERFGRRLGGESLPPANAREETIWKLVGLIESQYARPEYPDVYASLLAIHHAQEESVRLFRADSSDGDPDDVLPIVFAKGGASVLADACLAAGHLGGAEASFAFDWGVLLQMGDDLQDVREDTRDGLRTVFSTEAAKGTLDVLTSRTLHFALHAMTRMDALNAAPDALKDLLRRSSISLVLQSAGEVRELYSNSYIDELEMHSAFRFEFLSSRKEKLARHKGRLVMLFEAALNGAEDEPVFPVLPSRLLL